jgi:hypothetical protein
MFFGFWLMTGPEPEKTFTRLSEDEVTVQANVVEARLDCNTRLVGLSEQILSAMGLLVTDGFGLTDTVTFRVCPGGQLNVVGVTAYVTVPVDVEALWITWLIVSPALLENPDKPGDAEATVQEKEVPET